MYFKWNISFQWLLLLFFFFSLQASQNLTIESLLRTFYFIIFSLLFLFLLLSQQRSVWSPPAWHCCRDLNFSKFKENKNYKEKPWIYIDSFEELKVWETSPMVRVKVTKYKTWNLYILVSLSFFCTIPKTPYWKW